jgi:hypothetical protein
MLYFRESLLPLLSISDRVQDLDVSMLSMDQMLLHSVAALHITHVLCQKPDKVLSPLGSEEKGKALRMIIECVLSRPTNKNNHLLCILDCIILLDAVAAQHHLAGGNSILKHWADIESANFQQEHAFSILMLSIFATMDLTHALLIGKIPYIPASWWTRFGNYMTCWGRIPKVDEFLEITAIFSRLATIGCKKTNSLDTAETEELDLIEKDLEQHVMRRTEGHKSQDQAAWANFCACYQLSASVYLYSVLELLDVDDTHVQKAVTGYIEVMSSRNITTNLRNYILFPLLIIGSHFLERKQRVTISESISRIADYRSFAVPQLLQSFL